MSWNNLSKAVGQREKRQANQKAKDQKKAQRMKEEQIRIEDLPTNYQEKISIIQDEINERRDSQETLQDILKYLEILIENAFNTDNASELKKALPDRDSKEFQSQYEKISESIKGDLEKLFTELPTDFSLSNVKDFTFEILENPQLFKLQRGIKNRLFAVTYKVSFELGARYKRNGITKVREYTITSLRKNHTGTGGYRTDWYTKILYPKKIKKNPETTESQNRWKKNTRANLKRPYTGLNTKPK